MELTTAIKYGIPAKHVLNHALGKIAKEQRAGDLPVWHLAGQPRLGGVRRAVRGTGIRADWRDQLDAAMTELFAVDGPALLHVEQNAELL